ncbi:MAG: hypothetical protein HRT38_12915 [Alteromonadaceae bacterium]|nr:hypothetical protein [Alteromonadaceae bacterium]
MKQIDNQMGLSTLFNSGHQRMSDPNDVSSPSQNNLSILQDDKFSLSNFSTENRTAVGMKLALESISIRFSSVSSFFNGFNLFNADQMDTRTERVE